MSLKNYIKFGEVLSNNGLDNKFSVSESMAIAEDLSIMENAPQRITDAISEKYDGVEFDMEKLLGDIKESFKDVFESGGYVIYFKKGSFKYKMLKTVKSKKEADKELDSLEIPSEFDGSGWMLKSEWDSLSKNQIFESDEDDEDDEDTVENSSMDMAFNALLSEAVTEALMLIAEEEDEDEDEEVQEGARPKRLTGAAKKQRDAKSHLMKLLNKDPEISAFKERAKAKIIKMAKQKGKKAGIKVQRINFEKIKL